MSASIQALVRRDLEVREQLGIERYGTALAPNNGRDALRDAYEEALDLACYLKQALVERGPSVPLFAGEPEHCSLCGEPGHTHDDHGDEYYCPCGCVVGRVDILRWLRARGQTVVDVEGRR